MPPSPAPDAPVPASQLLRESTRGEHVQAENARFMGELIEGRLDAAAWVLLLEQLQPVYTALEEVAERWRSEPQLAALLPAGLDRRAAIRSDLAALRDRCGLAAREPRPVALTYRDRILACADDPARYLAHHYTRYLGDLSGGQIMRVRFQQHYGLTPAELTFFAFPTLPAGPVFKKKYRAALDAWAIDAGTQERLIEEAKAAFRLNQAVFADLDGVVLQPA